MAEPPAKRFRYETYTQQINNITVDTGKIRPLTWEDEPESGPSTVQVTPFTSELDRLSQLDLTLPFQELQRNLQPLTSTLPITLLNLSKIASTFHDFYSSLSVGQELAHSGVDSALQLHRAVFETTLGESVPYTAQAVEDIARVASLKALEPKIVERAYSTLSLTLRSVASSILKPDPASQKALVDTWAAIQPYLSSDHKRYVRRCIADAWVGVIRKARGDGLKRLMSLLLEDDTEGMEMIWAHSARGAAGQLHSRALAAYKHLLDDLKARPTSVKLATVKRVTTALVHHTTSVTATPVIEAVIARVDPPGGDVGSASAILRVLSTALFTRKGKRYPEPLLKPTMLRLIDLFDYIDASEKRKEWRASLSEAVVGVLMAGKLAQWLSPGVTMIEKFWNGISVEERFAFTNALIKLRWSGMEQFVIPHIARTVLPSLAEEPLHALILLNNIAEAGFLSGSLFSVQGGRWRQSLVQSLGALLDRLTGQGVTEAVDKRVLGQTLHLFSSIATAGTRFIDRIVGLVDLIIGRNASREQARRAWLEQGVWNDAHLLAEALGVIESFLHSGASVEASSGEKLRIIIERWSWSRDVLARVAELLQSRPEEFKINTSSIDHLYPNVLSADGHLRSATLKIVVAAHEQSESAEVEVWRSCLMVESSEMSLKNVRERTTQIARLGRMLNTSQIDETTVSRVISYLLSQHKVNFRPLYPETIKSLAGIGKSYGDVVWEGVWSELEKVARADSASLTDLEYTKPAWAAVSNVPKAHNDGVEDEEEPEYRCHNAEKMVSAVEDSWALSTSVEQLDAVDVQSQIPSDRLDVLNYEAQLLGTLAAITSVVEKHTRVIVPAFFAIADQLENSDDAVLSSRLSTRQRQQRTGNWMELFAKFVNPKAAFRSADLHNLYLRILSKGDVKLQGLAVSCLLTYKSAKLVTYEENLRHLLEESKFRDELARFALGVDSEAINPEHRDEIVPVTIRLLFGILTARRGRSSSQGLAARKRAVLTALSGCSTRELSVLVDLMLEPFQSDQAGFAETAGRQQLGYLSLLGDVLKHLAPQTMAFWPRLIDTTVKLIGKAQAQIDKVAVDASVAESDEVEEEGGEDEGKGAAPVRAVRSMGIKRIVQFLRAKVDFEFKPYLPSIFKVVISPRLSKLDVENTQAPSGVLDLIAAIAALPAEATSLIECDDRTLPQTFACLTAVKVKPAVITRVFDIIDSLLERDTPDILLHHIKPLLENIIRYVDGRTHASNDDLMRRLLVILSRISAIVTDGQQAQQLASLLCPMLRQSGKQQPEKMKVHVLETLRRLFVISPDFANPSSDFFARSYDLLSNLLQTVFLPATRRAVIAALETFGTADPSLAPIIKTAGDINAFSPKRLDEPDFDRRLTAFASITDAPLSELPTSIREWIPLLRTALFFIKDPEELSLRTNSSALLKRFIDLVGIADSGPRVDAVSHIILPGLRQSLRSKLELVRSEAIVVVDYAVRICDGIPSLVEMRPLLGEDDDTNFFVNISHIQVHRRARALRRLRDVTESHMIRESTIANIFLPILEHIITGSTEVTDHHFVNEAITTVGTLAAKLGWGKYNGSLSRYMKLGGVKSQQQKLYIRSVSAIIDNFHFDLLSESTAEDVDLEAGGEDHDEDAQEEAVVLVSSQKKRISDVVLNRLLPSLSKFVSQKDENEDNIRIPLALPTVKLAKQLPIETASNEIIRVVTIVSSILRSKDQDTRDIARDTMGKIAVFLGPDWLNRILAELQTALQRGPQKHIAAVTTHSILVSATTEAAERFSDLDDAVNSAIRISAEVVWGESGKDAADEGYKTKMREVRGATSRGFDTFQLLSRLVSPSKITILLAPIREVMHASQAVKTMTQVDEALRRVALGLNANTRIEPEDILSLCYSLISGNSAYLKPKRKAAPTGQAADAYRVQMKRDKKGEEDFYHLNAHKFVSFGLDLFITAFRRGRFDFDSIDILSRLGPLVNAIGNTLYSPTASVLTLGLKATAAVARCPLPQVDEALPTFVSNIFKVIKQQGGTAETEISQTALKTLAVILRDCKASTLSDTQFRYLLEIISPDLEETDRQASIFAILRSVVSRKFVVPEIYDLMGSVSSIMVTSQSTHVQDQCRGLLMAFLLDYPQGKGRIKAQMTFLAQNLDYVYESGRVSVMEFLSLVLTKFTDELIAEYADLFFVALTAVIANDEVEKCRTMAGVLLQQLVKRLEAAHVEKLVGVLKTWITSRQAQEALAGAAMAVFGLLVNANDLGNVNIVEMVDLINEVVTDSATLLHVAESDESAFATSGLNFNIPHHALLSMSKALGIAPELASSLDWDNVIAHLLFPHDWVRLASARLIVAGLSTGEYTFDPPTLLDIARKGCLILQGSKNEDGEVVPADTKLADQIVKILWTIAKRWSSQEEEVDGKRVDDDDHEADEDAAPIRGGSLAWLMSRMSFVARHIIVHRPSPSAAMLSSTHWTSPLMAILRFFAGVLEHLDTSRARHFMLHVLSPIYRILDDAGDLAVENGQQMDDLKQLATEVRDFVQTKVGTTEFSKTWESLRKRVSEKRDERRDARVQMAVRDPKAWAERKSKKTIIKKDSKKRRTKAFAEGRVQSKHLKRK